MKSTEQGNHEAMGVVMRAIARAAIERDAKFAAVLGTQIRAELAATAFQPEVFNAVMAWLTAFEGDTSADGGHRIRALAS